jgi:hypothetical protein
VIEKLEDWEALAQFPYGSICPLETKECPSLPQRLFHSLCLQALGPIWALTLLGSREHWSLLAQL